jgi:WD40 repeat protein
MFATFGAAGVRIWSASGRLLRVLPHDAGVLEGAVAWTSGDHALVAGAVDGTLAVWRAGDGERIAFRRGHDGAVTAVAIGPGGHLVTTGSRDGAVITWDLETLAQLAAPIELGASVTALSHTPAAGLATLASRELETWSFDSFTGAYDQVERVACRLPQRIANGRLVMGTPACP